MNIVIHGKIYLDLGCFTWLCLSRVANNLLRGYMDLTHAVDRHHLDPVFSESWLLLNDELVLTSVCKGLNIQVGLVLSVVDEVLQLEGVMFNL